MRNVHGFCLGPRHLRTPLFRDDLFDRVHETRLAQTGFPNDQHHLTHPFLSLLPAISEQAYFGITTGQRSERDWRWRVNPTSTGRALLRSHKLFGRIHDSIKDQSSPDVGVGPAQILLKPRRETVGSDSSPQQLFTRVGKRLSFNDCPIQEPRNVCIVHRTSRSGQATTASLTRPSIAERPGNRSVSDLPGDYYITDVKSHQPRCRLCERHAAVCCGFSPIDTTDGGQTWTALDSLRIALCRCSSTRIMAGWRRSVAPDLGRSTGHELDADDIVQTKAPAGSFPIWTSLVKTWAGCRLVWLCRAPSNGGVAWTSAEHFHTRRNPPRAQRVQ